MNKFVYAIILISTMFISFACDEDETPPTIERGQIAANISGESFSTLGGASISAIFNKDIFNIVGLRIADDTSLLTIQLNFPTDSPIEIGSYTFLGEDCETVDGIEFCGVLAYALTGGENQINYLSSLENGVLELEITDLDYRSGGFIEGTFSASLLNEDDEMDTKEVTNGEFNLTIQ